MRPEFSKARNFVVARTIPLRFDFFRQHDTSYAAKGKRRGKSMKRAVLAALAVLFCTVSATAPVRIVVPFGAGATPDLVARMIANYLRDKTQVPFIVENKPGAGGNTGTDAVAKAAPDGATIGISIGGPLAINTLLFSDLPYDPKKDLSLITMLVTQPSALAVNTALSVTAPRELLDLIAHNPGKYAYG